MTPAALLDRVRARAYVRDGDGVFGAFTTEDLIDALSTPRATLAAEGEDWVLRGGISDGSPVAGVRFRMRGAQLFVVGYEPG